MVQHTLRATEAAEPGARELANIAQGAAVCGCGEWLGALFDSLARAAEQRMSDFDGQDLTNIAWSFATAGQSHPQLFEVLARAARWRVGDLNT